jgi:hypothetical protein
VVGHWLIFGMIGIATGIIVFGAHQITGVITNLKFKLTIKGERSIYQNNEYSYLSYSY